MSSESAIEARPQWTPTSRALLTRDILNTDIEQRHLLKEYVAKLMVPDVDFGTIPGTPKPSLLKPGAEKLVDLFRCTPEFTLVKEVEDFDKGHGFFSYTFRARLTSRDSGAVLAEGYGSANSREGRYRWRKANRKCPACSKETIIPGKQEYGGGWLCFAKKGGCGMKFRVGDQIIEGQEHGQVENDDIATMANTILKMAKKRALVDGAIALARCSDMFTQDVEDFIDGAVSLDVPPAAAAQPEPESAPVKAKPQPAAKKSTAGKSEVIKDLQAKVDAKLGRAAPVLGFGESKGKVLAEMTFEALLKAQEHAEEVLASIPSGSNPGWKEALVRNLSEIRAELASRAKATQGEAGAAG